MISCTHSSVIGVPKLNIKNLRMRLLLQMILSDINQYGEAWSICLITADNTDKDMICPRNTNLSSQLSRR